MTSYPLIQPLLPIHKEPIRKLLWETNAFRSDEIEVALELVDDTLSKKGRLTVEDYHFGVAIEPLQPNASPTAQPESLQTQGRSPEPWEADELASSGLFLSGYVCFGKTPMTLSTFDLYWIAVHPKKEGKGIGRALMAYAEAQILSLGGQLLVIETSSQEKYARTRAFYEAVGCLCEATIKDFYCLGDHKLIYTKAISGKKS